MKGFVYVICNKGMPGLCKIGFTLKDPNLRAQELASTGSPYPYEVVYYAFVDEPRTIEQTAHKKLAQYRAGKEWFKTTSEVCVSTIKKHSTTIYYEYSKPFISIAEIEAQIKKEENLKQKKEELLLKVKNLELNKQQKLTELEELTPQFKIDMRNNDGESPTCVFWSSILGFYVLLNVLIMALIDTMHIQLSSAEFYKALLGLTPVTMILSYFIAKYLADDVKRAHKNIKTYNHKKETIKNIDANIECLKMKIENYQK